MFDAGKMSKYMWVAVVVLIVVIGAGLLMTKGKSPDDVAQFQPPPVAAVPAIAEPAPVQKVQETVTPPAAQPQTAQKVTPQPSLTAPLVVPKAAVLPVSDKLQVGHVPGKLKVSVAQLKNGERLPLDHTCYRKNISPSLAWTDTPAGTKEIVILLEKTPVTEKEKARPHRMINWAVYNIPSTLSGIPRGIPKAPLLQNGIGQADAAAKSAYIGPCQPKGKHEFKFRVFALDTALKLPGGVSIPELYGAMNGHILDEGAFTVHHFYK